MSKADWDRLVEEAKIANTDDYVDYGVRWAQYRIEELENAAQAVVDTDGPWREDSKQYIRAERDMMKLRAALEVDDE